MVVDCHAHFEPRMLDATAVIAKMKQAGVDRIVMIPTMNDPLPDVPEGLLTAARIAMRSKLTRPLAERIHRATITRAGNLKLQGKEYAIYQRPDNESVAQLVAAHPGNFLGWIFLNPRNNPAVLDELERWRQVKGMIGIKLHPHWHDYRTEILTPLLKRAEELRLPIMIHLGFGKRGDFRALCSRFPKLVIISAHAGFPFYGDLWACKGECPNLYVDLSSPYINERLARAAVKAMGPERCLYGTDAPYGFHDSQKTYDYKEIRGWIDRLPVSSVQKEGILGATFLEMLAHGAPA
jgi:predicted TIM-barrel fold metal-dependent hydrolase